jgi:hypothetical protein
VWGKFPFQREKTGKFSVFRDYRRFGRKNRKPSQALAWQFP